MMYIRPKLERQVTKLRMRCFINILTVSISQVHWQAQNVEASVKANKYRK